MRTTIPTRHMARSTVALTVAMRVGWWWSSAKSASRKCCRSASSSSLGGSEDQAAKKGRKKDAGCWIVRSAAQFTT